MNVADYIHDMAVKARAAAGEIFAGELKLLNGLYR